MSAPPGAPVRHPAHASARPGPRGNKTRTVRAPRHRPPGPPSPLAPRVGVPRKRQAFVTFLMLGVLLVFAGRLIQIQGIDSGDLAAQALNTRLVTSEIDVQRADIVDRNGVVLATSIDRVNVHANQQLVATWSRASDQKVLASGPKDAAALLAPILGMSEAKLEGLLTGDKRFIYVAKDVSTETWDLIKAEGIQGIYAEPTSQRLYPNGNVAGNVVGFVGGRSDKPGQWGNAGLEYAFEGTLQGKAGSVTYERGGGGLVIPTGIREESPAVPGSTVVTTLDRDLQWLAQQRAEKAVHDTRASSAIVIVQDVKTGQIYALVDTDSVDPSDPGATPTADRGSRAASSVFEPGSTAKVVTMAALLEEGLATPTSQYVAPYEFTTKKHITFNDSHEHDDWPLTLNGILVRSSNTGTVIAGKPLSLEQRYDYLTRFGLGTTTHVGLPGESHGILRTPDEWYGRTQDAVLFGQGVAVTALQTSQVYATIANGGVRVQPTVVSGFDQADGTFVPRETAEPVRVISEETSHELMSMLESVVLDGTGENARIPGYRVAGKTGTAQAAGPDGKMSDIVASFVGIAPAEDPRIVVTVIVFNPKSSIWGGDVAAPVFADVATAALQALQVPPSTGKPESYPVTWQ